MSLEELRTAYRSTWQDWARRTDALQQLIERPNPATARLEEMLLAVEQARAAHNDARDRLARVLGHRPEPVSAQAVDERVRTTARLLWEFAGRPHGTAESDWQRAQAMVGAAAQG